MKMTTYLLILPFMIFGCAEKKSHFSDSAASSTNLSNDSINNTTEANFVAKSTFNPNPLIISRTGLPDKSPFTQNKQLVGIDLVSLTYYSHGNHKTPYKTNTIKYNTVQTLSEYVPLQLFASSNFFLNNKAIKEGTYSMFFKPINENTWTLIINSETKKNKFLNNYDPTKNIAELSINPIQTNQTWNNLGALFENTTANQTTINIIWKDLIIPFNIKFNNSQKLVSRIERYFELQSKNNQPVQWDEYLEAANFLSENSIEPNKTLEWLNKSISLNQNYANIKAKAQFLAKEGKSVEALNLYHKANEMLQKNTVAYIDVKTESQYLKTQINNIQAHTSQLK